ncbi:beta-sandwich domain-containing protein [Bdellovibrio bacteriovorus]|uniref:beta-sandwich domain-containing protein n=1 Tax=Bdellovibrio bacteriovorus TaxID=959 RepID=UPI0021D29B00|nr:beta-sandwich domain-containing protein [Bdellovibrio bacteriovorus]UXR65189.1 beta-sandwich domain-containing protein [Bdellovibrio bacteriovorus]
MKTKLILGMLIATATVQVSVPALAQQQGRPGRYPQAPMPPPPPPGQGSYLQEGRVEIQGVTRSSGGAWYRVSLRKAIRLERVEVAVLAQRLKLHEAVLHTEDGQRIAVREFQNTNVINAGSRAVSEVLNVRSRIVAMDLRAESYGGYADISVSALSSESRPQLVVGSLPPPIPSQPSYPGHGNGNGGNNGCYNRSDVARGLERMGQEVEEWAARMSRSSYGSVEYNMASQQLQQAASRMVNLAQSREAQNSSLSSMETLGGLYLRKMSTYSYGSVPYNAFSQVSTAMFNSMEKGLDVALQCEIRTTDDLLRFGQDFLTKMSTYSYGTTPYNAYSRLAQSLFAKAPSFYEQESRRNGKQFRQMDLDMELFAGKMSTYSYGTMAYNSYNLLVQKAAQLSEAQFRQVVLRVSANERFELVRHFETRRNSYSYGSVIYNHYTTMKQIAADGR